MISGDVSGLGAFDAILARVNAAKDVDLRPLADRIAAIVRADNAAGLASGTDATGAAMAPLAPSTARHRSGPPGAATSLVNGFTVSAEVGVDGGVTLHARYADGRAARFFSTGTRHQPARDLAGLRPETRTRIQAELTTFARSIAAGR